MNWQYFAWFTHEPTTTRTSLGSLMNRQHHVPHLVHSWFTDEPATTSASPGSLTNRQHQTLTYLVGLRHALTVALLGPDLHLALQHASQDGERGEGGDQQRHLPLPRESQREARYDRHGRLQQSPRLDAQHLGFKAITVLWFI